MGGTPTRRAPGPRQGYGMPVLDKSAGLVPSAQAATDRRPRTHLCEFHLQRVELDVNGLLVSRHIRQCRVTGSSGRGGLVQRRRREQRTPGGALVRCRVAWTRGHADGGRCLSREHLAAAPCCAVPALFTSPSAPPLLRPSAIQRLWQPCTLNRSLKLAHLTLTKALQTMQAPWVIGSRQPVTAHATPQAGLCR